MKSETHEGRRWIGRVLRERWRIDARISRGGVGTVYAATHKNNGSRAAIKVLHPEFSRDADTRSRFLQEGYAANQVNHPGVVRIIDDDTSEDGHAYLVMELLEGEQLETRRLRKGGTLPLGDVYEVGEQLLDVLAAAHEKGIVHRDIKPDNLFITTEGRLKVLDFGFAQMRSQFRPDVTATGYLLGTPGFMSPEQAIGDRSQVDASTDIWAVGATLFTLISGEPVHEGRSAAEMLVAAANYQPRTLAAVTTGLALRLVEVVDRAVAYDKADRWPSARSMQLALRGVSGKQQAGAMSRRSIPDVEPVADGPLLHHDPMFVEELDETELHDSMSASWPHEPTVMADLNRPMPAAALPSEITRPVPMPPMDDHDRTYADAGEEEPGSPPHEYVGPHPADDDGPTLARPSTQPVKRDLVDPSMGSGTLIMESPVREDGQMSGAYRAVVQQTSPTPFRPSGSLAFGSTQLQHYGAPPAPLPDARPAEMWTVPPVQAPASPPPPTLQKRALAFAGITVATMVVVIVVGLLVLGVTE